ncbi:MAG: DUF1566 domain-containing protein [Gammaproteobacteria bacterium]|nr:DUF1566 domain-containing protein [Gammaproteobacteria bacterium]MDH5800572.1 DUF1566 domain-containing protein [Gammaproteobacteria bacterium]
MTLNACQNLTQEPTPVASNLPYNGVNAAGQASPMDQAACVFDQQSGLLWELKTQKNRLYTYSWFSDDPKNNGGFAGYRNRGLCPIQCDTNAYIVNINVQSLCGSSQWRLPTREELRSLVDYTQPAPGPAINPIWFPNTASQFYWSSTADANDRDSAWGIGFTFGFDYSYFKSDQGHIRLVSPWPPKT